MIFRIDQFFDHALCARIRAAMDVGMVEPAEIVANSDGATEGMVVVDGVRRASHIEIDLDLLQAVEARLDSARAAVEAYFGCALAEREGTSILRYPTGGFYRTHLDRGENPDWPDMARRSIALVVFLNSAGANTGSGDFKGGTLRLWPTGDEPLNVIPLKGTLVAFSATVLHEVTLVTAGTRDTVVDWFYDA